MSESWHLSSHVFSFPQAAHPDWNPTDPSGSLYLTKMADFSAAQQRRPKVAAPLPVPKERRMTDRAEEYERALKMSESAATSRRRIVGKDRVGTDGSILYQPPAQLAATQGDLGASTAQMAVTAVLEESTIPLTPRATETRSPTQQQSHDGEQDERDIRDIRDIRSELGDSYIDSKEMRGQKGAHETYEEEERPEGLGMLGLFAQIYGTRGPMPARMV